MNKRQEVQKRARELKATMVGKKYKHFKGSIYIVDDIGVHSETEEFTDAEDGLLVVYHNVNNIEDTWIRPYKMFISPVDKEKYPDVKQEMRFERYSDYNYTSSLFELQNS